jgi:hypothetical protein
MLRVPPPMSQGAQNNHPEAIEVHMVAYYYAALTNLFCQVCLSPIQRGGDNYAVRASPSSQLYLEVRDAWRDQVKDWTTISKKARTQANS